MDAGLTLKKGQARHGPGMPRDLRTAVASLRHGLREGKLVHRRLLRVPTGRGRANTDFERVPDFRGISPGDPSGPLLAARSGGWPSFLLVLTTSLVQIAGGRVVMGNRGIGLGILVTLLVCGRRACTVSFLGRGCARRRGGAPLLDGDNCNRRIVSHFP